MTDDAEADSPTESGSFAEPQASIRVNLTPRISFATYQCDIAVLSELVVANNSNTDLESLELKLFAEPPVIGERTWPIDRLAGNGELRVRDRHVTLAGSVLDSLSERMRAEVHLELRHAGSLLSESTHQISALARNEWGGADYMPELLAAFVMPNDPAIQRVLKNASRMLERAGKHGALEGYQARSRKRSWEIVSGVWAAVTQRGLTYAEPPASFGKQGQKIRFPSMIEEQGLATCLDTALLFAAAIEQAGLYPVVVFTEGHALAGAWLQPQTLPGLTTDDPIELRKAVAQKELVVFETTMATGSTPLPFSRALKEGERQLGEDNASRFLYALDIRQARGRDIQPLSSRDQAATAPGHAGAESARAAPALDMAPELPPFDVDEELPNADPRGPEERLDRWQRSLLDLSKRNRLLNLKTSNTALSIFCPNPGELEDKLADGAKLRLITPPERPGNKETSDPELYHLRTGEEQSERFASDALARNEIVSRLDKKQLEKSAIELYRKAKADFEEGGSNTLFLALGMLKWTPRADSDHRYRAPLILLPVKLERPSARSKPYITRYEDEPLFNLTLLQMLRQDFQIDIPGLESDLPEDEHGVDVNAIWDKVRRYVRDVPGFEVVEEVVLSTFSFAKYLMWKDLTDRMEALKNNAFVKHLVDTPREAYEHAADFMDPAQLDSAIKPEDVLAPLNADASQLVAIHASGKSGDFVLEGPPGTGKSETISNIIAHNIGLGRRVLFVSEKMAALNVVYRRLERCGLGDFCLELHSSKTNKREVLRQLGDAWQNRQTQTTEEWEQRAKRLGQLREGLNNLVTELHRPGPAGISPREAIGRSLRFGDIHRLHLDWERDTNCSGYAPTPEAMAELEELAKRMGQQFGELKADDLEVFESITHSDWSFSWASDLVARADKLGDAIDTLLRAHSHFAKALGINELGDSRGEQDALAEIAVVVPECAEFDLRTALGPDGKETLGRLEELNQQLANYRETREALTAPFPEDPLTDAPLENWKHQHTAALARTWPMNLLARGRLRKGIRIWFSLEKEASEKPEQDLETLTKLRDTGKRISSLSERLPTGTAWSGLKSDPEKLISNYQAGRRLRAAVARLSAHGHDLFTLSTRLATSLCDNRESLEPGMPTAAAAQDFARAHRHFVEALENYRTLASATHEDPIRIDSLAALRDSVRALRERERRLNAWCSWIGLKREAEQQGLGTLVAALERGSVSSDNCVESLRTAYASWIAPQLIDARPKLRTFSTVQHEDLIRTFRGLDKEVAEKTVDYIRATLSPQVPGRGDRRASEGFGILAHELQKKTNHKPVRRLVTEMGDSLTALTPCLMMSPLSVAQFLPADTQAFDLVVFDEASQITVPDAIGAIARGKRCIIVGDPKQMPPTRFFERGAEDDENEEARDLESILDEALAARVPHHRLTGHYRSRHESLIQFSNHTYYDGSLITFPSADTRDSAVSFQKVEGVYAKGKTRTNPIEAQAVVKELVRRLTNPKLSRLTVGIVTLNSEQQRLINDLIDQERRSNTDLEPYFDDARDNPVFVKNLETVQGDERDVILLSVGYGPSEPGARTMSMNFGPLNRQGGERRLNVAITRATTEVVIFASFEPEMVDLTRTSAEAVADLKHYIEYAQRGPVALGEQAQAGFRNQYDSDFECAVADRLRKRGWLVRTQVGVSKFRIDLGIVHPDAPGRFLAGIECDGATYHSSPTARDRDRVRHIVLEQLGWRLLRLWSTEYFIDPDTAIDGLDRELNKLLDEDRASLNEDVEAEAIEAKDIDPAPLPPDEQAYPAQEETPHGYADSNETIAHGGTEGADAEPSDAEETLNATWPQAASTSTESPVEMPQRAAHTLTPTPTARPLAGGGSAPRSPEADASRFYEPGYLPKLTAMACELIDSEGPITFKHLSDTIARRHGFRRTGKQISGVIWRACKSSRTFTAPPGGHKLFWPKDTEPREVVAYRGEQPNQLTRDWSQVPHPEKLGLVKALLDRDTQDLYAAVAEAAGIRRITTQFGNEVRSLRAYLEER